MVGAVQIVLLALLGRKQGAIADSVDGHLSRLVEREATPRELVARDDADRDGTPDELRQLRDVALTAAPNDSVEGGP